MTKDVRVVNQKEPNRTKYEEGGKTAMKEKNVTKEWNTVLTLSENQCR